MSAARTPRPGPDMGGLTGDWERLARIRAKAEDAAATRAEPQANEPDSPQNDAVTSRHHDATTDDADGTSDTDQPRPARPQRRARGGRRPAPAASDAVALTVRVDPDEATEIDHWLLALRDDAHRTRLDKAEAIRELLRLARDHEPTRKALLKRLT
ncbi:hypothetical protein ACH4E7_43460 [Kitasatospora sp. NPDC018058]|uniref:hypothetical protein n=1 Tax=Kitasatospora sp. NPDC018058 TaxID=3364025 RepID=UPI0037C00BFD